MKKKCLLLFVIISIMLCCVGCNDVTPSYEDAINNSNNSSTMCGGYFIILYQWAEPDNFYNSYYIVYAKDTKVKYFIKHSPHNFGITPLYNADGTLQIYEEEE